MNDRGVESSYSERASFQENLSAAVNKAFTTRHVLSSDDSPDAFNRNNAGIYESTDPRSSRIIVNQGRVVVQDLADYQFLLYEAFGKLYKDKSRILEIVGGEMTSKRRLPFDPNSQEARYSIDFFETTDGYPGINTSFFTINKFVVGSPEAEISGLKPKKQVDFVSQNDSKFQYVVDAGIVPDLQSSSLCWLAGIDIAISPFVPDSTKRDDILKNLVQNIKNSGNFNLRGGFNSEKFEDLTGELNGALESENVPIEATYFGDIVFDDLADKLRDGSEVLFGVSSRAHGGHLLVLSEILKEDGKRVFFQVYDPSGRDEIAGSKVTDNFTMYREHNNGNIQLLPYLIAINRRRDV